METWEEVFNSRHLVQTIRFPKGTIDQKKIDKMLIDNKIMDAMRKVRSELEEYVYKKYAKRNTDLCGLCAVGSRKLFALIHKIIPIYMVGNNEHWFNIVQIGKEEYLIDVTSTQFGSEFNKHDFRCYPPEANRYWDYCYAFSDIEKMQEYLKSILWDDDFACIDEEGKSVFEDYLKVEYQGTI